MRIRKLTEFGNTCFKCLSYTKHINHVWSECKERCGLCNGKHHLLLCLKPQTSNASSSTLTEGNTRVAVSQHSDKLSSNAEIQTEVVNTSALLQQSTSSNKVTVLQTAKTYIVDSGKPIAINVLFDCGSDRSYIVSDLAESCKLQQIGQEKVVFNSFGNSTNSKPKQSKIFQVDLIGKDDKIHSLNAFGINEICGPLFRQGIPSELLDKLDINSNQFSDDFTSDRQFKIHILIGLDHLWQFLNPMKCVAHHSLIAHFSVFGWVISGSYKDTQSKHNVNTQICCCVSATNDELQKFWAMDIVGVSADETRDVSPAVDKFNQTLKFENEKYTASLLWKTPKPKLKNNLPLVMRRQIATDKNLSLDLKDQYYGVFKKYEEQLKIKEICHKGVGTDQDVFYLPHFPVVKEARASTKVRPVFDGSARTRDSMSLNDALDAGPALHLKIFAILIRFRRWLISIFSDVESAFHAINLRPSDQNVCRFLLPKEDGTFRHMCFTVLPFGLNCSPFILNAVIAYHIKKYPYSNTVHELLNNIYVDDFTSGCDKPETAKLIYKEANQILAEGGLNLTKWVISDESVQKSVDCKKLTEHSILGMNFNIVEDNFCFKQYDFSNLVVKCTKRSLFAFIAKPFDPLGFLSPFIMFAKMIMQEVWLLGVDWDDLLPDNLCQKINTWLQSTEHLKNWKAPRIYFPNSSIIIQ